MSHKEQPELVTSGPYALIRHPIYTGLILAMLGSAIGVNVFWALPLVPPPSRTRGHRQSWIGCDLAAVHWSRYT